MVRHCVVLLVHLLKVYAPQRYALSFIASSVCTLVLLSVAKCMNNVLMYLYSS